MSISFASKVPPAALSYFGKEVMGASMHPVVHAEFHPNAGWKRQSYNKRISRSWALKLRKQGVTHVALKSGTRQADFAIEELTRR